VTEEAGARGPELAPEVERGFVEPSGEAFRRLVEVMARLRAPDGCPWDREQTHTSLQRHLLEETYEVLEAIDAGDGKALREELGDLVLQVVFHSEIAFEEGGFSVAEVLDDLRDKLVRRHPHVFGAVELEDAEEVHANWERMKRAEKGTGALAGIPRALPALARAAKVHRRALQVGFRWDGTEGFVAKLEEELEELEAELEHRERDPDRITDEVGDLLFMLASLAQHLDVDPETALRRMLDRFTARFEAMESMAAGEGRELESLSPEQWARYWERAKSTKDVE
jgi:tetrapyrrole methylase family protein / MazG family protein